MRKNPLAQIIRESLLKNLVALVVAVFLTPTIVSQLKQTLNHNNVGDFLLFISILLVTVCFANFAFSYEHLPRGYRRELKLLAHAATFVFMLLIGLLLITVAAAMQVVYPSLFLVTLAFSLLLYFGMALYDLWDSLRLLNR